MLRLRNLGSGSSGNATVVEARGPAGACRLLIDCGLGLRQLEQRLLRCGLAAEQIDAIFVTHEHTDHIGCARALALRHRIPVWMSPGTHAAIDRPDFEGLLREASDQQAIDLGELQLHPFTVPHDAREPLQLRCTDGDRHLGILTDLGHASAHVRQSLQSCHVLMLEFNHDADLLARSSYHPALKRRVGGAHGHLNNADAAALAASLQHAGLHTIVAAHLSRQNNRPELARAALAQGSGRSPAEIPVADPETGTDWIVV